MEGRADDDAVPRADLRVRLPRGQLFVIQHAEGFPRRRTKALSAAKAILIHGNGGCTAGDIWLPWLEHELRALGLDVINHTFPDNIKARAQFWLPHLEM